MSKWSIHVSSLYEFCVLKEEEGENEWEWKLLEAQVEKANVEPYIAALEAELNKPVNVTESYKMTLKMVQ
jgi:hypothetical protein